MKRELLTAAAVLLFATLVLAQAPSMAGVQKIYIDKLGNNDDAERFRSEAAQELDRVGFQTVPGPDGADAIIKGTFGFANYGENSGGQANVRLVNQQGKEIWGGSVADKIRPGKDSTRRVAQELAKTLKKAKERDAKGGTAVMPKTVSRGSRRKLTGCFCRLEGLLHPGVFQPARRG